MEQKQQILDDRMLGTAGFNGLLLHVFVWAGGTQVIMGNFAKCTTCASRTLLAPAVPPHCRKICTGTALPCQCATSMLGSCSPCSDLRRDTENETLFPDPLVVTGRTGSSCSHACREGSVGARVPQATPLSVGATGIIHCQPGEGWWPWELTAGVTCPELALLPRLHPGKLRNLCHRH